MRVKGRFVKRTTEETAAKRDDSMSPLVDTSFLTPEVDMPDPEAGFVPTENQPFRRLRRHTIT